MMVDSQYTFVEKVGTVLVHYPLLLAGLLTTFWVATVIMRDAFDIDEYSTLETINYNATTKVFSIIYLLFSAGVVILYTVRLF